MFLIYNYNYNNVNNNNNFLLNLYFKYTQEKLQKANRALKER